MPKAGASDDLPTAEGSFGLACARVSALESFPVSHLEGLACQSARMLREFLSAVARPALGSEQLPT